MSGDTPEKPASRYPALLRLAFALLAVVAAAWSWLILESVINGDGLNTNTNLQDNSPRGDVLGICAGVALAVGALWLLKIAVLGRRG